MSFELGARERPRNRRLCAGRPAKAPEDVEQLMIVCGPRQGAIYDAVKFEWFTTRDMCSFDCETAGLRPGDAVHVVSMFDLRSSRVAASFYGKTDTHLLQAIDALEAAPFLVSFNGAAFDLKMISARLEHTHDKRRVARLALDHYDIMLDFACTTGYYSSLESFLQASLDVGKSSTGIEAIAMWKDGNTEGVVTYCEDDARLTGKLYLHGCEYGRLRRLTASGKKQVWALPQQLFRLSSTALSAHKSEPPDVSWMTDPPNMLASVAWAKQLVS